ncbi:MAG: hypothetical protein EAZ63_01710 [Runella slithyformis]|nr:MAG: hypothetical protein EAZ63_01710 [Runella slithyformis]
MKIHKQRTQFKILRRKVIFQLPKHTKTQTLTHLVALPVLTGHLYHSGGLKLEWEVSLAVCAGHAQGLVFF